MKFYDIYIRYRFWIGLALLAFALVAHFVLDWGFWGAFFFYLGGVLSIATHFFFGPLRLIQSSMEEGNIEGAKKVLDMVWFPNLLFKPIRSLYFTLKGNLAMAGQNFDEAEMHLKKGQQLAASSGNLMGMPMNQAQGANHLQLGMIAYNKNDLKTAEGHIRQALKDGLPDKENKAMAYLQMCSLMMNKRQFKAAKDFFNKAKAEKPTAKELVDQIKQMEKYINRMPG